MQTAGVSTCCRSGSPTETQAIGQSVLRPRHHRLWSALDLSQEYGTVVSRQVAWSSLGIGPAERWKQVEERNLRNADRPPPVGSHVRSISGQHGSSKAR